MMKRFLTLHRVMYKHLLDFPNKKELKKKNKKKPKSSIRLHLKRKNL